MKIHKSRTTARLTILALALSTMGAAMAGTTYTTQGATNVTASSATLNGSATATCLASGIQFNYGATAAYGFSVNATPGSVNTATAAVSGAIGGLVCNTTYHYKLTGGTCAPAVDGADMTFTTAALGAPTGVSAAVASATSATVNWTAPASNCGSAITNYTVQAVQDPSKTCSVASGTSCTVSGLSTGVSYTFTVTATNGNGIGEASAATNVISPGQAQAITGFSANPSAGTVGNSSTLSATGGASGSAVTFASTTPSICTVSGSKVSYVSAGTCTVTANQAGNGSYAAASQVSLSIVATTGSASTCFGVTKPSGFQVAPCVYNIASTNGSTVMNGVTTSMASALGLTNVHSLGQGSNGVVQIGYDGGRIAFMPVNVVPLDSRANGVYPDKNGTYVVVNNGTALYVTPGVLNFDELANLVSGWSLNVDTNGTITATNTNGLTYSVKPAYAVQTGATGGPAFVTGADGYTRFVDSAGNSQILYPAFVEPDTLQTFMRFDDPAATVSVQLDGTATAQYRGISYKLTPDATLAPLTGTNASTSWWNEGGVRYRMRDLNRMNQTQGFSMQ